MEPWFQIIITIFSSVLASSGLWAYLSKRTENKDVKTEMLIGLAHWFNITHNITIFQYSLKTFIYTIGHRNIPCAVYGFRR